MITSFFFTKVILFLERVSKVKVSLLKTNKKGTVYIEIGIVCGIQYYRVQMLIVGKREQGCMSPKI